jgi:RNA polymerase sigma factor (sigma-70 family)
MKEEKQTSGGTVISQSDWHPCSDVQHQTPMSQDRLYEQFTALVARLIRQYGRDTDLGQELRGEIYCRFCMIVEAFDPTRGVPFRPYVVRQLTASVYTYARQWRQVRVREVALDPTDSSDTSLGIDPTGEWVETIADQQTIASLPEAVAKLPLRQRQVVIWRFYEEKPFDEIAELLNVRTATVRSLLRHGLNKLRKSIEPVQYDDHAGPFQTPK